MALAVVDGRAGIRICLETLLPVQINRSRVGFGVCAKVVDGSMQGSVSVAADREIRFLRAHALVAVCGHRLFWGKLFLWVDGLSSR